MSLESFISNLPAKWQIVPFDTALDNGTRNGIYKSKEFHGRGVKIVNMGELFAYPRLFAVDMKRIELDEKEKQAFLLQVGDLMFARRSLVAEGAGRCSIVCEIDEPTTFESSIIRARPNPNISNSLFLFYLFSSPLGKYLLGTIHRQTSVSGITGSDLVKLKIPLPPLKEQQAIAHIIGTLDDKIELNQRINETLEAMAHALFKSWFVDFDPVRAKAEGRTPYSMDAETAALFPAVFEDSQLGEIPKGWKVKSVYETAQFINGRAFRQSDFAESEKALPIIKIVELKYGITSQTNFTEQDFDGDYALENGDILFSWSGSPDTSIDTFIWTGGKGWLNQHIFKVVAGRSQEKSFVYFLLRLLRTTFVEIARDKQTTGLGHVTIKDLKNLLIAYPCKDVLLGFDKIADQIFNRIIANSNESQTLVSLRDLLLPKLLTGELCVKDAEKRVAEVA